MPKELNRSARNRDSTVCGPVWSAVYRYTPSSIGGQGYTDEDIQSGLRVLAVAKAWLRGLPKPAMEWTRNGPVPTIFDLPFLKLGQILVSPDFILSFQPPLLTAALATILYLWLRKLCSPSMSLLLTLSGAFGTMLWPYAYRWSEKLSGSFFVLLAGYLALANGKLRTWPRLLLFAATCGCAISMKSVGMVLWPAIAYLIYVQFRGGLRSHRRQIFAMVVVIGTIWALGALGRHFYWAPKFGSATAFRFWLTSSAFQVFSNIIGVFGSPTKGLFVYSPLLLAGIYAVRERFAYSAR